MITKTDVEASFYLRHTSKNARFPNITAKLSQAYVSALYKRGAASVEVHEIDARGRNVYYVVKIVIRPCKDNPAKLIELNQHILRGEPTTVSQSNDSNHNTIIIATWLMEPTLDKS